MTGSFWSNIPAPVWNWGPAIIILLGIYILAFYGGRGLARLLAPVLTEFVAAQRTQAAAMTSQAESMKELAVCIKTQRESDAMQYDQVMLMLKVLRDEVRDVGQTIKRSNDDA